jgi:hypothetical protein
MADVDDMSPLAIQAFLNVEEGGEQEVEWYDDSILTEYFGEFSPTVKSFRVTGEPSAAFKEYASFCIQWMLMQQSSYMVTKARGSIVIAEWENRALDGAAITSEMLIREVTATYKSHAPGLAYWLGMLYLPPPRKKRPDSRPVSWDPSKGKAFTLPEPEPIREIGTSGTAPAPENIPTAATAKEDPWSPSKRLR